MKVIPVLVGVGNIWPDNYSFGRYWTKARCKCCGTEHNVGMEARIDRCSNLQLMERFSKKFQTMACPACHTHPRIEEQPVRVSIAELAIELETTDIIIQQCFKEFLQHRTDEHAQCVIHSVLNALDAKGMLSPYKKSAVGKTQPMEKSNEYFQDGLGKSSFISPDRLRNSGLSTF